MRILFVSHSFAPADAPLANVGGMQRVAMELCAQLEQQPGVEIVRHVLAVPWKGIERHAIPFIAGLLVQVPRLVRKHHIDAVVFSSITTALPAMAIAPLVRRQGALVASIAHGLDVTEPHPAYQAAVRRTLASLDLVLPVSRATGEMCRERGARPDRVVVVPNGVDLGRFEPVLAARKAARDAGTRARLDASLPALADDQVLLLSIGRQVRRKGFAWFAEHVMPRLPEHVEWWLAGDGPDRPAIEAAITRGRVGDRVRMLGLVPEDALATVLARAELFVMPNVIVPGDMEGFGIVMLEAGAAGMATVAAALEGISDVIRDGVNGRRVASGETDAWVAAVREMTADRAALADAGLQAAAYVRETFDWRSVRERYVDAIVQARAVSAS
jgi:phosphatidylinositol alpha-1,6-mannosyltransferase